jgi:hypothetical protein
VDDFKGEKFKTYKEVDHTPCSRDDFNKPFVPKIKLLKILYSASDS